MNRKKIATAILTTSFCFSTLSPTVFADKGPETILSQKVETDSSVLHTTTTDANESAMKEANISKDEAIKIATSVVTIPTDFKQQGINFFANDDINGSTWRVHWMKEDRESYSSIEVTINADNGEVSGINIWNDSRGELPPFPPKVSYNEAVETARDYINSIIPNKTEELVLDQFSKEMYELRPFRDRRVYDLRFHQLVNDIPFKGNSVSVGVDGSGKVVNFNYNWFEKVDFDAVANVLSQEEVNSIVDKSIDMELTYLTNYNEAQQDTLKLAYVPKTITSSLYYNNWYQMLDAKTGEWVGYDGKKVEQQVDIPTEPISKTAKPLKEYSSTLTQDQALQVVKDLLPVENLKFNSANYYEYAGNNNTPIWAFDFNDPSESNTHPRFIRAEVNALTGELISFMDDNYWLMEKQEKQPFKASISKEEAIKIASEFVKTSAPHIVNKLYATMPVDHYYNSDEEPRFYNVFFVRKEDGIPVQGQGVNVRISTETGDISEYRSQWRDVKLPDSSEVISVEEAKKMYVDDLKLELNYNVFYSLNDTNKEKRLAKLVYQPQESVYQKYLDAKTGVWMNLENGKPLYESKEATDIAGHWAEEALSIMVQNNIIELVDGKVNPNAKLTRAELVEMFMKSIGGNNYYYDTKTEPIFKDVAKEASYYGYLANAVNMNLIEGKGEFKPDQLVDREFMAVLVVKSLGYDKLASVDNLFPVSFKDGAEIKQKGHVGLVNRLGIMLGSEGKFHPKKEMTKAEAAMTLYRLLEKRSEISAGVGIR